MYVIIGIVVGVLLLAGAGIAAFRWHTRLRGGRWAVRRAMSARMRQLNHLWLDDCKLTADDVGVLEDAGWRLHDRASAKVHNFERSRR